MREVAYSDYIWRTLCVRGRHGAMLDFTESVLGTFSHPDAQDVAPGPKVARASSLPLPPLPRTAPSAALLASLSALHRS